MTKKWWNIENWNENNVENIENELQQLKRETLWKIIDEKKKDDIALYIWKESVINYLLDEDENKFKIWRFFKRIFFRTFFKSIKELEKISEDIKKCDTKNELKNLEQSIINWINTHENENWHHNSHESYNNTHANEYPESARVWEAKEIPNNETARMKWLFPEWIPQREEQMKKYLITIKVPAYTTNWNVISKDLTVHKKLANEISAVFNEMCNVRFPINTAWCYSWRYVVGSTTNKRSQHSYWSAIDINWGVNWWGLDNYWPDDPSSPYHITDEIVKIWERHWFNRWWRRNKKDPMHFSYINW